MGILWFFVCFSDYLEPTKKQEANVFVFQSVSVEEPQVFIGERQIDAFYSLVQLIV